MFRRVLHFLSTFFFVVTDRREVTTIYLCEKIACAPLHKLICFKMQQVSAIDSEKTPSLTPRSILEPISVGFWREKVPEISCLFGLILKSIEKYYYYAHKHTYISLKLTLSGVHTLC